jgi:hypothetical protein
LPVSISLGTSKLLKTAVPVVLRNCLLLIALQNLE